jgi:hypothetical protein
MAKNNPIEPIEEVTIKLEEQTSVPEAVVEPSSAMATTPTIPIPKTDAERNALERELTNYSRKAVANMTPEEAAPFHARRYHICLALRGVTYDRATVPIPLREEEREALEHELENPNYYPPNKIVEVMTWQEESAWRIRRRQIMFALRGEPDDTTPAARDLVRRCCGQK